MRIGSRICAVILVLGSSLGTHAQSEHPTNGSVLLSAQVNDAVRVGLPPLKPRSESPTEVSATEATLGLPKRKNKIIRLPRVVVEGERPPIFREQDIYTPEALRDIAVKRYFAGFSRALNRFKIPILGGAAEEYALARWWGDERLRLVKELEDQIELDDATGNAERAEELREIMRETLSHQPQFLNSARTPFRDARGE